MEECPGDGATIFLLRDRCCLIEKQDGGSEFLSVVRESEIIKPMMNLQEIKIKSFTTCLLSVLLCILCILISASSTSAKEKHPAHKAVCAKASAKTAIKNGGPKSTKNVKHGLKTASGKTHVKSAQKMTHRSAAKISRIGAHQKKHGVKKKHMIAEKSGRKKRIQRGHASHHFYRHVIASERPVPGQFHYTTSDYLENQLQEKMEAYIGIPYRSGGESFRGMDCSGFSRTLYANLFGISLPHNSAEQFEFSKLHTVDEDNLKIGDLLFFSRRKHINHVGVYLGEGNFIHATNGSGITVSSLNDTLWKSQIVAAKRPMSFDKSGGAEAIQLEGSFKIPFSSGQVSSYTHDQFHPDADSPVRPDALAAAAGNDAYRLDSGHLYTYEFEYSQKLWNENCDIRLSAIREKFDKSTSWNVYDRTMDEDWPVMLLDSGNESFLRHGFKVASSIRPFEGFSITPSFLFLNYEQPQARNMMEAPTRIFGLNTQMVPRTGPWSVSMAAHYADQQDMIKSPFLTSDAYNNSDMSFKLAYFFTNNVELSLMGKHDFNTLPSASDFSTSGTAPIKSDLMLKFDMKY